MCLRTKVAEKCMKLAEHEYHTSLNKFRWLQASPFSDFLPLLCSWKRQSMDIQKMTKRICASDVNTKLLNSILTFSEKNTSLLAFILSFKSVFISTAASIPKLCTGVGLFVVVPANDVVSAGALVQDEITAGVKRGKLCRKNYFWIFWRCVY